MNPLDQPSGSMPPTRLRPDPCAECGSRIVGICASLDSPGLDEFAGETTRQHVVPHGVLFRDGDHAGTVVLLMRGMAKLSRLTADGRQQVLGFRFAGDVLGFTEMKAYAYDAEMLTEGDVCRVPRPKFEAMLARFPAVQRRFLALCSRELALAQDQLVTIGRRQAEQRVAAFLLSLREAARRRGAPADLLEMPMTRAEIGDLLGLALETVSRSFSALRRRRLVREPETHRIELLDIPGLARLANGDDGTP
ncbi:MAG: Crp/Fnr family transcriptional regulator [Pseudomonadota bacterium]